jgi:hypothetical protein
MRTPPTPRGPSAGPTSCESILRRWTGPRRWQCPGPRSACSTSRPLRCGLASCCSPHPPGPCRPRPWRALRQPAEQPVVSTACRRSAQSLQSTCLAASRCRARSRSPTATAASSLATSAGSWAMAPPSTWARWALGRRLLEAAALGHAAARVAAQGPCLAGAWRHLEVSLPAPVSQLFTPGPAPAPRRRRPLQVVNQRGERWELQLKGAGLTPFSRQADGRKVWRTRPRCTRPQGPCSPPMHPCNPLPQRLQPWRGALPRCRRCPAPRLPPRAWPAPAA